MARISVVLPAPFGPSTPMNSPGADGEAYVRQNTVAANPDGGAIELDNIHENFYVIPGRKQS